tara:strand:- start:356 stop:763 length:408 start_codon:yes stop_codon:yes gene_type:complete
MSSLTLIASFILCFAIGTCWLACSFDARIERSRLVQQNPLPLSAPGSIRGSRQQSGLRPAMALGGFLLVLFSGMSAVIIGTLTYLQSPEVTELQQEHPLLNELSGTIMGMGPIVCVVMGVVGTCLVGIGLGHYRR